MRFIVIITLVFCLLTSCITGSSVNQNNNEVEISGTLGHRRRLKVDDEQFSLTLYFNNKKVKTFLTNENNSFSIKFTPKEYGEYKIMIPTNHSAWVGLLNTHYLIAGIYEKKFIINEHDKKYNLGSIKFNENPNQEFKNQINNLYQSDPSY